MTRSRAPLFASLAAVFALAAASRDARADEQLLIKQPGEHPQYVFDAEPHGVVGFGPFRAGDVLPGVGFRGTVIFLQQGPIPSINNSMGIGFGGDVFFPNRYGAAFVLPVVAQWNFWLSTHWAVFGEPGFALGFGGSHDWAAPVFAVGGRYHFNERIALTLRLGYPYLSAGVSFYF